MNTTFAMWRRSLSQLIMMKVSSQKIGEGSGKVEAWQKENKRIN